MNETLLWHFNFPLAKLLMLPHALIKSWCKPCTTETWLWYHLPLTGCQVWIMSWWVRDCIRHLGDTVNSGWPRAWSTVQSRHISCLPGFQVLSVQQRELPLTWYLGDIKHVTYGKTRSCMDNALCLTKNQLLDHRGLDVHLWPIHSWENKSILILSIIKFSWKIVFLVSSFYSFFIMYH